MTHFMKIIKILLSHIRDKNKIKIRDSLFPLVQCFKTTFCYNLFNVSTFKAIICFIWFNISRLFISLTHTKLFAFPFNLFTFAHLYTHAHTPLCHLISNTLKQKMMLFTFNLSTTPT